MKAVELYTKKTVWEQSQLNGVAIINSVYGKEKNALLFFNKIEDVQQDLEKYRAANFLGSLLQHQTLQATKYMSKWIESKNSMQ